MAGKLLCTVVLICLWAVASVTAQESRESEKIRGSRFIPYPNYPGAPFLNDKFLIGEIEFTDGSKRVNIALNYGCYRDELIYYNQEIKAQIVIDKNSLNGFSFVDKTGRIKVFRRLFFTGYFKGDCFFELLSPGKISLLAYRKVNLEACDTYYSKSGMAYQPSHIYYIYSPEKGYDPVKLNRKSLLSKYIKSDQKLLRKTLRKNNVVITDEASFIRAWNLIDGLGLEPIL